MFFPQSAIETDVGVVAQIDRDWSDEDKHIWGYQAEVFQASTPTPLFPAVAVFAGFRQVFLRKIEWSVRYNSEVPIMSGLFRGRAHISKVILDPSPYNPVAIGPTEFVPGWNSDNRNLVPRAVVIGGFQNALQLVEIKGSSISGLQGPAQWPQSAPSQGSTRNVSWERTIVDFDDPPLTLRPFEVAFVQLVNPLVNTASGEWFNANIWLSERDVEV